MKNMPDQISKQNETLYRKKPVVVAAMQWDGKQRDIYDFLTGTKDQNMSLEGDTFRVALENGPCTLGSLYIKTLGGEMKANLGDWIIKGVNGEFYPCKPDIFEKTYELVCCTADSEGPADSDMHNEALIEYTLDEGKKVSVTIRLDNLHRDTALDVTENIVASELEAILHQAGLSLCVARPPEQGKSVVQAAEEIELRLHTLLQECHKFSQGVTWPIAKTVREVARREIAATIKQFMDFPTEKTKVLHDAQVEFLQRELVRLDPEYFTRPRENNSRDWDPGDTEGPSRWR